MKREQIEELAVSYAAGDLAGKELARFNAWRVGATVEELAWFAAIVDTAGELAMGTIDPVVPPDGLKEKLMSKVGLDAAAPASPDFSFMMGADSEDDWTDIPVRGARMKVLSDNEEDGHTIFVLELGPDTTFPAHRHQGAESAYVLSGDLEIEGRFLRAGDFSRAAPGSRHRRLYSRDGCRALMVTSYDNFHEHDN